MVHLSALTTATAASLLFVPSVFAAGLYTKKSAVLNVDAKSYDVLIAKSNYTSIVEFYAPWCGHCQNLKPAYEKAAESLKGQAKVAAINCDDEENKPLCGSMGVQGFPTLKIVRPGKPKDNGKRGRPVVEDYQGARNAKAIVEAVRDKISNHVKRLKDSDYEAWLDQNGDRPKAILFSEKGTVSSLLKAVAIDFLGAVDVAQIRDKEKQACEVFGVDSFPSLVLLPGSNKEPVTFDGALEKDAIVKFISQAAEPNPDPATSKKSSKSSSSKKDKSASSKFSKASASHASSEAASGGAASQTAETLADESNPTESPDPRVDGEQKPIKLPDEPAPPIKSLQDGLSLQQKCFNDKAGTCILLLLPEQMQSEAPIRAIMSLSEIHHKHEHGGRNLFPFYQLPTTNSQANSLRKLMKLGDDVALIATNGKRSWYKQYPKTTYAYSDVEDWIDAIRMGEGEKQKLSPALIIPADQLPAEPVEINMDDDMQAMRARWKESMPEGVDVEFEEIDDVQYEAMMKASEKKAKAEKQNEEHDEL